MSKFFIPKGNFEKHIVKKYRYILDWFDQNLNDEYNVFIEFKIPNGRQIDLFIISKFGGWLLEEKGHDFVEISINGPWKFKTPSGKVRNFFHTLGTGKENPNQQAINSANSLSDWLKVNGIIELNGKSIFPCVVFPDSSSTIMKSELDKWCYFSKGVQDISTNFNRKWRNEISDSTIIKIISIIDLEEIS